MLRFTYGARSHVGLVRTNNEDSGFAGPYLQLVADGVGGAAAGEIASATTAYVVSALAAAHPDDDPGSLLTRAVQEAHRQLEEGVATDPARAGMATTLTAVLARGDRCLLVHVGDSRGYLLRDGGLTQLTTDHTLVQSLVDEGRLTREQVVGHPYRSMVLRWVDGQTRPEPDLVALGLRVGDRLLVCSDGLSDLVPDGRIASLLAEPDPDTAAAGLVDAALEAGGKDNVTCLVADVVDGPVVHSDGRLLGAMRDPSLVVDPGAVRSPHPD